MFNTLSNIYGGCFAKIVNDFSHQLTLPITFNLSHSQSTFTCSKLTLVTLEYGVSGVALVSLLLALNIFHTLF